MVGRVCVRRMSPKRVMGYLEAAQKEVLRQWMRLLEGFCPEEGSQTLKLTANERTGVVHDGVVGWWGTALEGSERSLPPLLDSYRVPSPVSSILPKMSLSSEQPHHTQEE